MILVHVGVRKNLKDVVEANNYKLCAKNFFTRLWSLVRKIPFVAGAAFVVASFAFKGQMEADRPYIFVELLKNIKVKGSAFNLDIGNSGKHPATDIRLKYMLLADCKYQEMAKHDVTIGRDIVKAKPWPISFGTNIYKAKEECVTKTNLLVLVFKYVDPHIWDNVLLNYFIPNTFYQQFFFSMSVKPGEYYLDENGIKLISPEIREPIRAEDVGLPEKYTDYFEKNEKWLHEWEKGFPHVPNLTKESIFKFLSRNF